MSSKKRLAMSCLSALAVGASLVYVIGRARAAGVPATAPVMSYSGTLTDANGTPLTGTKNIQVLLWAVPSGGSAAVCQTTSTPQTLLAGNFQIALPDTCVAAVHANAELWAEVSVDGAALPRTKIGAVPYALEAGVATSASGALDTRLTALMPPKSIIMANLTAADMGTNFDATGRGNSGGAYGGWAICNGQNGTPNLANRFVRVAAAAGATGGNDNMDHSHAIDHDHNAFASGTESGHTHSTPAHNHLIPVGWDGYNYYFTGGGGVVFPSFGSAVITEGHYTAATDIFNYAVGLTRLAYTDTSGSGTTGAGDAHSHSINPPPYIGPSGPSTFTDNRPAFYELVALMRL
jgi:hypothetical protein